MPIAPLLVEHPNTSLTTRQQRHQSTNNAVKSVEFIHTGWAAIVFQTLVFSKHARNGTGAEVERYVLGRLSLSRPGLEPF